MFREQVNYPFLLKLVFCWASSFQALTNYSRVGLSLVSFTALGFRDLLGLWDYSPSPAENHGRLGPVFTNLYYLFRRAGSRHTLPKRVLTSQRSEISSRYAHGKCLPQHLAS